MSVVGRTRRAFDDASFALQLMAQLSMSSDSIALLDEHRAFFDVITMDMATFPLISATSPFDDVTISTNYHDDVTISTTSHDDVIETTATRSMRKRQPDEVELFDSSSSDAFSPERSYGSTSNSTTTTTTTINSMEGVQHHSKKRRRLQSPPLFPNNRNEVLIDISSTDDDDFSFPEKHLLNSPPPVVEIDLVSTSDAGSSESDGPILHENAILLSSSTTKHDEHVSKYASTLHTHLTHSVWRNALRFSHRRLSSSNGLLGPGLSDPAIDYETIDFMTSFFESMAGTNHFKPPSDLPNLMPITAQALVKNTRNRPRPHMALSTDDLSGIVRVPDLTSLKRATEDVLISLPFRPSATPNRSLKALLNRPTSDHDHHHHGNTSQRDLERDLRPSYRYSITYNESSGPIFSIQLCATPYGLRCVSGSLTSHNEYNRRGNLTLASLGSSAVGADSGWLSVVEAHAVQSRLVMRGRDARSEGVCLLVPLEQHPRPVAEFSQYATAHSQQRRHRPRRLPTHDGDERDELLRCTVHVVQFNVTGEFFVSGGYDGTCMLFDAYDGTPLRVFYGNSHTRGTGHIYDIPSSSSSSRSSVGRASASGTESEEEFLQLRQDRVSPRRVVAPPRAHGTASASTSARTQRGRGRGGTRARGRGGRGRGGTRTGQTNAHPTYNDRIREADADQEWTPAIFDLDTHSTHPFLFVSCGLDGSVFLWDMRGASQSGSDGHGGGFGRVAVSVPTSERGSRLSMGSNGRGGSSRQTRHGRDGERDRETIYRSITEVRYSEGGKHLGTLTRQASTSVYFGRRHTQHLIYSASEFDHDHPQDGKGSMRMFDVNKGTLVRTQWREFKQHDVSCMAVSESGSYVVAGTTGTSGLVAVYDAHRLEGVVQLRTVSKDTNCVSISPCDRFVTAGSAQGDLVIYDTRFTKAPLHRIVLEQKPENAQDGVCATVWLSQSSAVGHLKMLQYPYTFLSKDGLVRPFVDYQTQTGTLNSALSTDVLVSSGSDGCVSFWDPYRSSDDVKLASIDVRAGSVNSLGVLKRGFGYACHDDSVAQWTLNSDRRARLLETARAFQDDLLDLSADYVSWQESMDSGVASASERVGYLDADLLACGTETGDSVVFGRAESMFDGVRESAHFEFMAL